MENVDLYCHWYETFYFVVQNCTMYYIVVYGWTLLTNVVKTLHSGVQIFDLMYSILYCCKISNISVLLARPVGCCSWSTFRQLTDQDVSGLYFRHYFLFFLFLLSSTLLIEGVIKSKILFRERKKWGKENFPDPVGHFEAPRRPLCILNKVRHCRGLASDPVTARLVFSYG